MKELKNCPFCGGKAEIKVHNPEYYGYGFCGAVARCTVCGAKSRTASITYPTLKEDGRLSTHITPESIINGIDNATKLWNRRTDND